MSISIEWSFEKFLYDVVFENAFDFEIKMSLKTKKWEFRLRNHFDRNFVLKLRDIIKRSANIEYIENKKFRIFNNHNSINEIFDIFIVDFVKQMIAHKLFKVRDVFFFIMFARRWIWFQNTTTIKNVFMICHISKTIQSMKTLFSTQKLWNTSRSMKSLQYSYFKNEML